MSIKSKKSGGGRGRIYTQSWSNNWFKIDHQLTCLLHERDKHGFNRRVGYSVIYGCLYTSEVWSRQRNTNHLSRWTAELRARGFDMRLHWDGTTDYLNKRCLGISLSASDRFSCIFLRTLNGPWKHVLTLSNEGKVERFMGPYQYNCSGRATFLAFRKSFQWHSTR